MISLHTSPLDQPGTGDAGGMNVYVIELSRRLAQQGIEVDIFTRATSSALDPVVEAADGVPVRHIHAGPFEGLTKGELPGQLCVFAREVLRAEAGAAGRPLRRRALPLLALRPGRRAGPRPLGRPAGAHHAHDGQGQERRARRRGHPRAGRPDHRRGAGRRGRRHADRQHRPRGQAADQPVRRRARPRRGRPPGRRPVGVPAARPGRRPGRARAARGRARAAVRRPDPAAQGARTCCCGRSPSCSRQTPALRSRLVVPVVGGPSGTGLEHPESLAQLATELGLDDVVRFVPPVAQAELARWCAAATLVAVPSYNESFGLVAAEAQATGTPVARRGRRRPDHGRARRPQRPARRRPRAARLGRRAAPGARGRRRCGCGSRRARSSRRASSRGSGPPSGPSRSTSSARSLMRESVS